MFFSSFSRLQNKRRDHKERRLVWCGRVPPCDPLAETAVLDASVGLETLSLPSSTKTTLLLPLLPSCSGSCDALILCEGHETRREERRGREKKQLPRVLCCCCCWCSVAILLMD